MSEQPRKKMPPEVGFLIIGSIAFGFAVGSVAGGIACFCLTAVFLSAWEGRP